MSEQGNVALQVFVADVANVANVIELGGIPAPSHLVNAAERRGWELAFDAIKNWPTYAAMRDGISTARDAIAAPQQQISDRKEGCLTTT